MACGTGRQTAAMLDILSVDVERSARRVLRAFVLVCSILCAILGVVSLFLFTGLTSPDVCAVSPRGQVQCLKVTR